MSQWLKSAVAYLGRLGPDPNFVAFNAHCWFAFSVFAIAPHYLTLGVAFAAALAKEFLWDLAFEVPKQTLLDSAEDFAGYAAGLLLGAFVFL